MAITKLGKIYGETWDLNQALSTSLDEGSADRLLRHSAAIKSKEDPTSYRKALSIGGGIGAILGAVPGAINRSGKGAFRGAALGAAAGGLLGAGVKKDDDTQIEDARRYLSENRIDRLKRRAALKGSVGSPKGVHPLKYKYPIHN